jgi:hypothetical protein
MYHVNYVCIMSFVFNFNSMAYFTNSKNTFFFKTLLLNLIVHQ